MSGESANALARQVGQYRNASPACGNSAESLKEVRVGFVSGQIRERPLKRRWRLGQNYYEDAHFVPSIPLNCAEGTGPAIITIVSDELFALKRRFDENFKSGARI
jgi:hypothetical protein